jgi:hypothetical protein
MSIQIGVEIPEKISIGEEKISIGETVKWSESHSDFEASDGWTLTYYFANAITNSKFSKAAEAYLTTNFLMTLNPAAFGASVAGKYRYEAYVTNGTDKVRLSYGEVELLADLTAAGTTELAYKTNARRIFEALEATIEGRASNDQSEMKIRDRSIKRYTAGELQDWYTFFKNIVAQEEAAERIEQGKSSGNIIKARFNSD